VTPLAGVPGRDSGWGGEGVGSPQAAKITGKKNNLDLIMTASQNIPVITIDGPGGTGKGTISLLLAQHLQWHFLDSGVLYRVLAYAAEQAKISWQDPEELAFLAQNLDVKFCNDIGQAARVLLAGTDVTGKLRTEICGSGASQVSAFPPVRQALLEKQRAFRKPPGLVTDGRDMGTVIFPDANLKIFLTASTEERAKRRHNQLKQQGINVTLHSILQDLNERDARDQARVVAPLKPASDAIIIDTTFLTVEQVFQQVLAEVKKLNL
jgi:cytidylate kinase